MLVCPDCGNLRSVCSDPSVDWHPHKAVCYASAAAEWGARVLQERFGDTKAPDGALPLDGVKVWVAQEPPEVDEFA